MPKNVLFGARNALREKGPAMVPPPKQEKPDSAVEVLRAIAARVSGRGERP